MRPCLWRGGTIVYDSAARRCSISVMGYDEDEALALYLQRQEAEAGYVFGDSEYVRPAGTAR